MPPRRLALGLGVVGLMNIQFAVSPDEELYVIEANPRASRTVPFVSKAVGVPLAKVACRLMLGEKLADMDLGSSRLGAGRLEHVCVKEAVLPFDRFPRSDALLGPEMKSTGEVMGVAADYPAAFGKAQAAAGAALPAGGGVFISVTDSDKPTATQLAAALHDLGFSIFATGGTAQAIRRMGVPVDTVAKVAEGSPNVVDLIESGEVALVINTPTGSGARTDGYEIRRAAWARSIPCITTMTGATAAQRAIRAMKAGELEVRSLQELHGARRVTSHLMTEQRTLAPFGRRRAKVSANRKVGGYVVISAIDPSGPVHPRPGQFYMLAAEDRWGGGEDERPYLPRAFSFAKARRVDGRRGARLPARGRRPRHRAARRARAGRRPDAHGPARHRLRPRRPRAIGPGGRRHRSRAAALPRGRPVEDQGPARLPLRRVRRRFAALPGGPDRGDRRWLGGPQGAGHGAAQRGARRRRPTSCVYACGPPGMLEGVRAICAEHDGARSAGDGVGNGLWLRCLLRLRGAHPLGLRAPLRRRPGDRRRRTGHGAGGGGRATDAAGRSLRGRARGPDPQRVRHLRRHRCPPRFRRRPGARVPLSRLRLEDDHRSSRGRAIRRRVCGRPPPG